MYFLNILICFSLFYFGLTLDATPVFIINYSNIASIKKIQANPLQSVSEQTFTEIAEEVKNESDVTILFVLDKFSTEDITRNPTHEMPFKNLKRYLKAEKLVYLPSVIKPYNVLSNVYNPDHLFPMFTSTNYSNMLSNGNPYFRVYLKNDDKLNRTTNLRKHDVFISRTISNVVKGNNLKVSAFLTSLNNPVKCDTTACYVDDGRSIHTDKVKLWLHMFVSESPTDESEVKDKPTVTEAITDNMLRISLKYKMFNLEFDILLREDDWILDEVRLIEDDDVIVRTNLNVGEAWDRGYGAHRGVEPLVIKNTRKGSSVTIKNYQIQPYRIRREAVVDESGVDRELENYGESNGDPDEYFHIMDATYLSSSLPSNVSNGTRAEGPFFTSGILTALITIMVSIMIMSWGITLLFNCHSNDRYDDPLQKPLVITAN